MRSPKPVRQKMETEEKYDLRVHQWQEFTLDAAKAAAPFIHPRLQAIEHSGPDGEHIPPSITVEFVEAKS